MAVERSPVTAYAGNSPAAKAISDLWVEIERILEGMQRSSGQIAPRKIPRIRAARG
jgi:hypothetical protein